MTPSGNLPKTTIVKRIICLANSRKFQERCIAGRELSDGAVQGWIRPVSDRYHEAVSEYERQYDDGSEPQLLDIIDVPLLSAKPNPRQQENWLVDPQLYWVKVGTLRPQQLRLCIEQHGSLWNNGWHSSNGINDYVTVQQAEDADRSLRLILVGDGLQLHVHSTGAAFGKPKRQVRAHFSLNNVPYRLVVTDPVVESVYLAQADGVYMVGSSYLTISLGEPLNGKCFKLVAAIIGA